jgi:hypothetical protein
MKAFEVYQKAKRDHIDSPEDLELLRSTYMQKAWADKKCAALEVADESEREVATIEWMMELGEWFRQNVLEYPTVPGKKSRKKYFLELFDTNPEGAIRELDDLFMSSRH